jgi:adenosylcobinamide amidohydrolase
MDTFTSQSNGIEELNDQMKLATYYSGVEVHRAAKIVYAKFLAPHRVLSTCPAAGGLRDDMQYLYNHQSCEPAGNHMSDEIYDMAVNRPAEYRRLIAERHGLPPDRSATLGTAANMNNVALVHEAFHDLEVIAVCTGGVGTNAGRAGDPASYIQMPAGFEMLDAPPPGTIITMLLISHEITPGAMVGAVITATEAKSAALQELGVPSRYSDSLATGTGTDQIGVACRLGTGKPLTDAGKHAKLGELIGRTVHSAVKQALAQQNSLTPLSQRSALRCLERFGATEASMCEGIDAFLPQQEAELIPKNFLAVTKDALTVAAVAALVHLRDKFAWGILPVGCLPEVLCSYGAQLSAAVSGKYDRLPVYREQLAGAVGVVALDDNETFLRFVYRAFALGFGEKWTW